MLGGGGGGCTNGPDRGKTAADGGGTTRGPPGLLVGDLNLLRAALASASLEANKTWYERT